MWNNQTMKNRKKKQVKPVDIQSQASLKELTEDDLNNVNGGGLLIPAIQRVRTTDVDRKTIRYPYIVRW